MLISLNEIKKLVNITIPDDELLDLIGSRLVEIESVTDWSKRYKKIYLVKVLSAEPIEGTHLHLCQIDAGKKLNAETDPEHPNYIQVVCGAPNVKKDMFAVWIAPGAIVPATAADPEPFKISARKLRDHMSFGMLAGADELGLGDDHSGIVEINPNTTFAPDSKTSTKSTRQIQPGDPFADVFDLNDQIIEVENKSLTHRPDCFGLIGFAREVAGILDQKFTEPESQSTLTNLSQATSSKSLLKISTDPTICPNYQALVFSFANLPESTPYLSPNDIFLYKAGMRPTSPIVDATNLIMLKTGQPLHAFDYDKFLTVSKTKKPEIIVRLARPNEQLILLDSKELALTKDDIVICSGDTPVALAGAMGGQSTAITEETKNILVEIASFSLYNLRKTQMAHGIFSEAITRFTKGRPATDLLPALNLSVSAFQALGAQLQSHTSSTAPITPPQPISVTVQDINSLLGSTYSQEQISQTLTNVGFSVQSDSQSGTLKVTAPTWRSDINIKEDITEEVGRLLGYDNLPLFFPTRPFSTPFVDPLLTLKSKIRAVLSDRLGLNEVLTYSFVSQKLLQHTGFNLDDTYKIINSISPELECFRPALLPSLLSKLPENLKASHKNFSLYELNQISSRSLGLDDDQVPNLETHLAFTTFGDFYAAKFFLTELFQALNQDLILKPCEASTLFEPLHSAEIYLKNSNQKLGTIGEIKASVLKNFKLSTPVSGCELSLGVKILSADATSAISENQNSETSTPSTDKNHTPKPLRNPFYASKFQSVSRDLTVKTSANTPFATIQDQIQAALAAEPNLLYTLEPLSIFINPLTKTNKNLSFRLTLAPTEKTFNSNEVSAIIEKISKNLVALGAEVG